MNIEIKFIPKQATEWDVTRAIADILHDPEYFPSSSEDKINFKVDLVKDETCDGVHMGAGFLVVPTHEIGVSFLRIVREKPIRLPAKNGKSKAIKFYRSSERAPHYLVQKLGKTVYVPPEAEEEHLKIVWDLQIPLAVESVQVGVYFQRSYPGPRLFSVEWEDRRKSARLIFEYQHKLIRVEVSQFMGLQSSFEHVLPTNYTFSIPPCCRLATLRPTRLHRAWSSSLRASARWLLATIGENQVSCFVVFLRLGSILSIIGCRYLL